MRKRLAKWGGEYEKADLAVRLFACRGRVVARVYTARMSTPPRLRVVILGSGSAGNAAAVTFGDNVMLVDCGFSAREVARRLTVNGIDPMHVRAILITHEHGDHVRGVDVFARRHAPGCAVIATGGTLQAARLERIDADVRAIAPGDSLGFGEMTVRPFRTSHDATDPVGWRVESPGGTYASATDTGILTPEAAEALSECEIVGLESNHDLRMLEVGPYPYHLKQRIRSARGHLSNDDAAAALERIAHPGLKHVFALHRSRTNNTRELAASALEQRAARLGLAAPVTVAGQDTACDSSPPQGSLFDEG